MSNFVIWQHASLVTMDSAQDYGFIEDGALVVNNGYIEWVGPTSALPENYLHASEIHQIEQSLMTPGLIDCHTHLVYAGNRAHEFKLRMQGLNYEAIAKQGGGIASTVEVTRKISEEALFYQSAKRLQALLHEGVTTIEIKSGYGLDLETERKILRVANFLQEKFPVCVQKTFLGAHVLPKEFQSTKKYIQFLIEEVLPTLMAENLVDAIDGFCEKIAFSATDLEVLLQWAKQHHLKIKLHAEQLSNAKGAILGAKYQAVSVDHLEYLDQEGANALKMSNTVAVLLPGAYYFLQETCKPPVALLRALNVPIAIATDSNPGTSPTVSLLLMMNMSCLLFGLTPLEALQGVTRNAAKALGYQDRGILAKGMRADFVIWDMEHPDEFSYRFGENRCRQIIQSGKKVHEKSITI
ncbi:MAG: imidazolonepropionase [Gammaproteobacteria bacterium 39-13]|nr:imidazolonepropionase [Gammaproteobacteria bacterium]OJV91845.1 MAG: imidazolonepropionase [Gammaproteobacteria bacterium 39-13]